MASWNFRAGILILLFIAFLGSCVLLVYIQFHQTTVSPPPLRESIFIDSAFTKDGYIKPLEETTAQNRYSSKAYVRGKVVKWEVDNVTVQLGTVIQDISVEKNVQLRCFDEYIINPKGERIKKEVMCGWM